MEKFLAYLYEGKIFGSTFREAEDLASMADKYNVQSLVRICVKMLETKVDEKNALRALYLSDLYPETSLREDALAIIAKSKKLMTTMTKESGLDMYYNDTSQYE